MTAVSDPELVAVLAEHVDFMRSSAARFDEGVVHEAKRLATSLRVLLHDTRHSRSLLKQLGVKDMLLFTDTALHVNPNNLMSTVGLTGFRWDGRATTYFAVGLEDLGSERSHPPARFEEWWTRSVIKDAEGAEFNRRDLVLALANKDGGAHVDLPVSGVYRQLSKEGSLGWVHEVNGAPMTEDLTNPVPGSVRQICAEVLDTLERSDLA